MKLCASNIGWSADDDDRAFQKLKECGFSGVEIAPTRIVCAPAYTKCDEAAAFAQQRRLDGLAIPSMQSIWYGRQESIFGPPQERQALAEYTRQAVDFAAALGCGNLVFGCPRNRAVPQGGDPESAVSFFEEIGAYAAARGCTIALEANPVIYNTNFMNTTPEAFSVARRCGSGVSINLDVGTMVYNGEDVAALSDILPLVSHVHISEPHLAPIERRPLHRELAAVLQAFGYDGFVSVEMKTQPLDELLPIWDYVAEVFG